MDGFLRQSTASQSRLIGAFLDDTDFKTEETGLTIGNTDIKLRANGTSLANKNSGGGSHQALGHYSVTWDATDTANVGELKYFVKVAGALPVWGSYVVLEESIYDALFAASAAGFDANQRVNLGLWLGSAPNALSSGRVESLVGALAANVITAAGINADAFTAAKFAADVGAEFADAVWDEVLAGHLTAGSTGAALNGAGGAGDPWASTLPGAYAEGTAGSKIGMLPDVIAGGDGGLAIYGAFGWVNANIKGINNNPSGGVDMANALAQIASLVADMVLVKLKTDNLPSAIARGSSIPNFTFPMKDADGNLLDGLTVSGFRRLDAGMFEPMVNPVVQVSGEKMYTTDVAGADTDGAFVTLKFSAPGAVTRYVSFITEPA